MRTLESTGMSRPQAHEIADAIATLINTKIAKSEGRHHARFHKARDGDDELSEGEREAGRSYGVQL